MTQGNIGGRRDSGLRELGPDDTPEYTEWLRHNPTGFVLILTGGLARLHEADCAHIQPYPTDKKGMPKVVELPRRSGQIPLMPPQPPPL
jgi:hypothetical protein